MSNFNGFTGNNDPVYYSRQTENTGGALTGEDTMQASNSPVIPDGYVMVAASLLSELRDWAHPKIEDYCEMWAGRRDDEFPSLRKVIADADALLAAAPQSPGSEPATVPGKWIPVSERLPEEGGRYWCYVEEQNSLGKSHYQWNCSWNGEIWGGAMMYGRVTHWMPLPAAPQEVKGE